MAKNIRTRSERATQQVLLPGRDPKELVLTFGGNIIKHLGVQMYAGRPVPAIAELISNAWDADATDVAVRLPLDEAWDSSDQNQTIEVSDDGNGMTWEMVRDAYLDVGRDRREVDHTDKSPGGRLLQGRKGVGIETSEVERPQPHHHHHETHVERDHAVGAEQTRQRCREQRVDVGLSEINRSPAVVT